MAVVNDDMEMEKIAEDELAKLQRQFRIMEIDRGAVTSSARPTLRTQRNCIKILNAELDKIMMELKLTKSPSNLEADARTRETIARLLRQHDAAGQLARARRSDIAQLDFLLGQVAKEVKTLRSKGAGGEDYTRTLTSASQLRQLDDRLDTAMKKFNAVNSDNRRLRLEIDRLLRDRQSFNAVWKAQVKRLMDGKSQILELVEQAISTYDQREEWCGKLDALREKAALDYRKHCLEMRELQRQLEHSMKLEEFLRTKGTVRLTAADAKAEARRQEKLEEETRIYNNYVNILDALKEFTGDDDVERLSAEFTRREEENYALFNYINEVNAELKHLHDNTKTLAESIEEERAKYEAKKEKEQESKESLQEQLAEREQENREVEREIDSSQAVLDDLLERVNELAQQADCGSLPMLQLLEAGAVAGPGAVARAGVNASSARLYLKGLEKRVGEIVEVIKLDEAITKRNEAKERTPPSSRRRRAARRSPRDLTPRAPLRA